MATESPLKMMKNPFYFTSKAFYVLKILKYLSRLFGHVPKRLDQKDKFNFKFYDVTAWLANNCNTHNTHTSRRIGNQTMKLGQSIECNMANILQENHTQNVVGELVPDCFLKD